MDSSRRFHHSNQTALKWFTRLTNQSESLSVKKMFRMLKESFSDFDEVWLVSDVSSKASTLIDFGIIDQIDLIHADNHLGDKTNLFIPKPPKVDDQYFRDLVEIDQKAIAEQLNRVKEWWKSVFVVMPWANSNLEFLVATMWLKNQVILGSPLNSKRNFELEDKEFFSKMMDELKEKKPQIESWVIPWMMMDKKLTYDKILQKFNVKNGHPIYIQKTLSAGGDGTRCFKSREEFKKIKTEWFDFIADQKVKLSMWVTWKNGLEAYPSNFQACIIPDWQECHVIIDAWSHKPVGLKSLGFGELKSWVGNDRGTPRWKKINKQAEIVITEMCKKLYDDYGYTGIIGIDGLKSYSEEFWEHFKFNELNPRFQWTTQAQNYNALMNDQPSIEFIHYLVKLANNDKSKIDAIKDLIGDPKHYNEKAMNRSWGYYMKIMPPLESKVVTNDVNWSYLRNGKRAIKLEDKPSLREVYMNKTKNGEVMEPLLWHVFVSVKWPQKGSTVGWQSATKIWMISWQGLSVFEDNRPDVTKEWKVLYDYFLNKMFEKELE